MYTLYVFLTFTKYVIYIMTSLYCNLFIVAVILQSSPSFVKLSITPGLHISVYLMMSIGNDLTLKNSRFKYSYRIKVNLFYLKIVVEME